MRSKISNLTLNNVTVFGPLLENVNIFFNKNG